MSALSTAWVQLGGDGAHTLVYFGMGDIFMVCGISLCRFG